MARSMHWALCLVVVAALAGCSSAQVSPGQVPAESIGAVTNLPQTPAAPAATAAEESSVSSSGFAAIDALESIPVPGVSTNVAGSVQIALGLNTFTNIGTTFALSQSFEIMAVQIANTLGQPVPSNLCILKADGCAQPGSVTNLGGPVVQAAVKTTAAAAQAVRDVVQAGAHAGAAVVTSTANAAVNLAQAATGAAGNLIGATSGAVNNVINAATTRNATATKRPVFGRHLKQEGQPIPVDVTESVGTEVEIELSVGFSASLSASANADFANTLVSIQALVNNVINRNLRNVRSAGDAIFSSPASGR